MLGGDCGRGGEEDDRLFTAMKTERHVGHTQAHTKSQKQVTSHKIITAVDDINGETTMIND